MILLIKPVVMTGIVIALGLSQPAAAGQREAGRVLMGLAGVAILAHALNQKDRRGQARAVTPQNNVQTRRRAQRIDYSQCLRQRWARGQWETFVASRCVNRLQRQNGIAAGHRFNNGRWNRGGLPRR